MKGKWERLRCWVFGHKLYRISRSTNGDLEHLICRRCRHQFAMHHPTQYFGRWDWQDWEVMKELGCMERAK